MPTNDTLRDIILAEIKAKGPMTVDRYMELCLAHPDHGYYMTRDPLGAEGDFTTAPEISQIFGEIIGAWIADLWHRLGSPTQFTLLELGPGRGTLMRDTLRIGRRIPGFSDACDPHLLEISHALKVIQKETLRDHTITWIDSIDDIPSEIPLIIIANEFFDALPIKQFIRTEDTWQERALDHDLNWTHIATDIDAPNAPENSIYETCPAAIQIMQKLQTQIKTQTGGALIIDYGYDQPAFGDTLQAVHKHEPCGTTEHIGNADLTTHVNFHTLYQGLKNQTLTTQRDFLIHHGGLQRALLLAQKDLSIMDGFARLTDPDKMGHLFKVLTTEVL